MSDFFFPLVVVFYCIIAELFRKMYTLAVRVDHIRYCDRRYFRVYKFSHIPENWQFRADLFSRF